MEPFDQRDGRLTVYKRRMLVAGFAILGLSFVAGICLSFYEWDSGSPFDVSGWGGYNPLGRATYAPVLFAFLIFPISLPIALLIFATIYVGLRKERLWPLPLLGFLSLGLLWLWYIRELWEWGQSI